MSVKSIIITIISVALIAMAGISCYIFWPAIKGTITGASYYTADDLQSSYDNGFNDGNENKIEMQAKIDYYSSLVDQYYTEVEDLNKRILQLVEENGNFEDTINSLNQLKTEHESTINSLTETNNENEKTIENANIEIERLTKEVENLTQSEQDKEETIKSLNVQISDLQSLVIQLQSTISLNTQIIQDLTGQVLVLNNQIKELNLQIGSNNNDIIDLNNEILSLKKSVAYYENYILELESQNHTVAVFEFDGSVYKILEIGEDLLAHVDNPESTEYVIFNYWMVNNERVDLDSYQVIENTKFVANVTYKYKVKFMVDETETYTQTILKGEHPTSVNNPIKDKYNFVGWSIDGVNVIDINSYEINSETTFIAIFIDMYGLFNPDTNQLIYTWKELLDFNYIKVTEESVLSAGVFIRRIFGNLIIDNDITEIADDTFSSCSALVSIELPKELIRIGENAFYDCSSLETIKYDGDLINWSNIDFANLYSNPLGARIFYKGVLGPDLYADWTTKLNKLYINGGTELNFDIVENIKNYSFVGCQNISTIVNDFDNVGDYAFAYCGNLTSLHSGFNSLGSYAFAYCSNLISVDYSNNENLFPVRCFYKCTNLSDVSFSTNITKVGDYAFCNCSSLTSFNNFQCIRDFGQHSFDSCKLFNPQFNLLSGVCNIGDYAFHATNVINVILNCNISSIGKYAFGSCNSLKYLTLGQNINYIAGDAFDSCINLIEINYCIPNLQTDAVYLHAIFSDCGTNSDGIIFRFSSDVQNLPIYIFGYDKPKIKEFIIESALVYTKMTYLDNIGCIYNLYIDTSTCPLFKVYISIVDGNVNNSLNNSMFSKSVDGNYYVFKKV